VRQSQILLTQLRSQDSSYSFLGSIQLQLFEEAKYFSNLSSMDRQEDILSLELYLASCSNQQCLRVLVFTKPRGYYASVPFSWWMIASLVFYS
jgi:hypothetical protein